MSIIGTRLSSNGVYQANALDEVTAITGANTRITSSTVYASQFDEVSLSSGSISFDGSGDYITIPQSSSWSYAGDYTIEFYLYLNTNSDWCAYDTGGSGSADQFTGIGGTVYWNYPVLTGGTYGVGDVGKWVHWAVCRSGSTVRMFKNGVVVATGTDSSTIGRSNADLYIGRRRDAFYNINGYLSNMRVLNGTALYTANFTPPGSSLYQLSNTVLLLTANSSNPFKDGGLNNNTLTLFGDTKYSANGPFNSGSTGVGGRVMSQSNTGIMQVTGGFDEVNIPAETYWKQTSLLLTGDGVNGANNNVFVDSSTNNLAITRSGNVAQGTFNPFSLADGQWSNYFDGSGDYLSVLNNTAIQLGTTYTVEGWFYTGVTTNQRYFGKFTGGIGGWLLLATSTAITWYFAGNGGTVISATVSVPMNAWNHIAISTNGSIMRMWLNGVSIGTYSSPPATQDDGNSLLLGSYNGVVGTPFNGYISNFRIVNGSTVYDPSQSTLTIPTSPLTAISGTSLLTCQSNRFKDNSSNNFTITPAGDTKVTAWSPFDPMKTPVAGSAYFDGSGDYLTTSTNTWTQLGTGNFTIEGWCYINAYGTYFSLVDARSTGGTYAPWVFGTNASGYADFLYGGSSDRVTGSSAVGLNQWVHLAAVRNGSTVTLYVNGVSVATNTYSSAISGGHSTPSVGRLIDPYYANGYISNLRVVVGTAVYTSNFTVPTTPLTGISNTQFLLSFTNAGIYDNTGKNCIETVGDAQISTSVVKYGSGSMKFDGTGDYLVVDGNADSFAFGTKDFTIEAWIYAPSLTLSTLIDFRPTSTNGYYINLYLNTNGSINFYTNGSDTINSSAGVIVANTWTHIALSRSGSSTKLFVNGTQSGSTYTDSNNYISAINRPVVAGSGFTVGTGTFTGYIDDLRITKGIARYTANFTPPDSLPVFVSTPSVDYLVVAGGGGSTSFAGGGGGGGLLTGSLSVSPGINYTITIGGGGAGNSGQNTWGANGTNSVFSSITTIGGGGGAARSSGNSGLNGYPGGSGGGGSPADSAPYSSGGSGTSGQGFAGGNGGASGWGAGGGGGAAEVGKNATASSGGDGANGASSLITTVSTYYAAGGGGGTYSANYYGKGGLGGGGNAVDGTGGNGTTNSGSGGGSGGYSTGLGGTGGSGIVVIRYPSSYGQATTTGSPTYTLSGSYHIYTFTGSGTITF